MTEIVVTGIGPVSAVGCGQAAWTQAMADGRVGLAPGTRVAYDITGEVRDFVLADILPSMKTYNDRASEYTLAAVQLALRDAGLDGTRARWRTGIVLGSTFGCLATLHTYTAALQQKGARFANPLLFTHTYVNTPTSLAAIEFGLGGHHGTFAGTDAGAQALEAATEALLLDRADIIVAVGVDALCDALLAALDAAGALTDPPGEGACALVLETAAHATARGVHGRPLPAAPDPAPLRAQLGNTFAAEPFFAVARALG